MKSIHLIAQFILSTSSGLLSAQTLLIDDFISTRTGGTRITSEPSTTNSETMLFQGNPVGDTRYATLTNNTDNTVTQIFSTTVSLNPIVGTFASMSVAANRGGIGSLSWEINYFGPLDLGGGGTPRPTGFSHRGLGLDISTFRSVETEWYGDRNQNVFFSLGMMDASGKSHTEVYSVFDDPDIRPVPTTIFHQGTARWELGSFASNGIDLTNIETITFSGTGPHTYDVAFGPLGATTIPEPSSVFLGLTTMLASILLHRKRTDIFA